MPGVVVPMPTLLFVARKIVDVPTAVFVPLKYAVCPVVPVKLPAQMPLAEVQILYPFIVEVAENVAEPKLDPPVTVSPVVVAFWKRAPTKVLVEVAETENKVEVPPWPFT